MRSIVHLPSSQGLVARKFLQSVNDPGTPAASNAACNCSESSAGLRRTAASRLRDDSLCQEEERWSVPGASKHRVVSIWTVGPEQTNIHKSDPLPSELSVAFSLISDSAARVRGLRYLNDMCNGLVRPYIRSSEARTSVHDYQRSQLPLAQCSLSFPLPTPPHRRAPLTTQTICAPDLDRHPYEVL
jgi:hypothetical protein